MSESEKSNANALPHWRTGPALYDPQLEWLLCCSASACGERGTTGAVIAAIERGGQPGEVNTMPFTDEQFAWLRPRRVGSVHQSRVLWAAWYELAVSHQTVLAAWYSTAATRVPFLADWLGPYAAPAVVTAERPGVIVEACARRFAGDPHNADEDVALLERTKQTTHSLLAMGHNAWRLLLRGSKAAFRSEDDALEGQRVKAARKSSRAQRKAEAWAGYTT